MANFKGLWAKLNSDIIIDKTTIASNLTAKGVSASSTETLTSLAAKIASIEVMTTPEKFINKSLIIPNPPTINVTTSVTVI